MIISLEDFNSYQETIYLMQSQNNAKRLNRSILELENSLGFEKINSSIKDIKIDPFKGVGEPEPLKYSWSGY